MVNFAGKYMRVKDENNDAFLKALGVGMLMRKAAGAGGNPTVEISEAGGKWKLLMISKMKTIETLFEPGKAFDEKTGDGRDCSSTIEISGNTWTQKQKNKGKGKDVTIIREFSDKGIDVQMICDGVIAKQTFERQ